MRDLDRTGRKAMAEGRLADDRLSVERSEHPAHRTGEADAAVVPTHRPGEREPSDDRVEALRHHPGQRLSRTLEPEEPVAHREFLNGHPVLLREARSGPVGEVLRWPLEPLVRGTLGKILDQNRKPTRAREEPVRRHTELALAEHRQLLLRLAAGPGRKLLAADLKQ